VRRAFAARRRRRGATGQDVRPVEVVSPTDALVACPPSRSRSKRLLRLKKEVLARLAHPPLFLPLAPLEQDDEPAIAPDVPVPAKASPNALSTASLPALPGSRQAHSDVPPVLRPFNAHLLAALGQTRFDTVVVTPPAGLSWAEIAALPIRQLTADPAFVYLWVGEGGADGLEKGREALARWGFRRCEEIVWVKTNKATAKGFGVRLLPGLYAGRLVPRLTLLTSVDATPPPWPAVHRRTQRPAPSSPTPRSTA
jgi:hypothetical protein